MAISNDPNDPSFGLEADPTHPHFGLAPEPTPAAQPSIGRVARAALGTAELAGRKVIETVAPNITGIEKITPESIKKPIEKFAAEPLVSAETGRKLGGALVTPLKPAAKLTDLLFPNLKASEQLEKGGEQLGEFVAGQASPIGLLAAAIPGEALAGRTESLSKLLFPPVQKAEEAIPSLTERAAAEVQPRGGEVSATQERQVQEGIQPERAGDGQGGASAEAGRGSGVQPAAQVEGQKVTPGDRWYQGVSKEGATQWVTHDINIAKSYAERRGEGAKVNVYTPEQVGETAFADPEGNLISPQEYAKHNWSTTIQTGGKELPKPIETLETGQPKSEGGGVVEKVQEGKEGQGREGVLTEPAAAETPPSPAAAPQSASPPATPTTAVRPMEQPEPKSPTALKNEIVDQQRVERGMSPRMQQARQSFGTFWDDAIKEVDKANVAGAPHPADELVKRFQEKPFALGPKEDALILHRQVELENAADQIGLEQQKARESGDQATLQSNNDRIAVVLDNLHDTYNVGQAGGRLTAQGLAFRRQMVKEDFSLGSMVNKKRAVNDGRELTPKELEDVQYYNREILAADQKWQQYQKEGRAETSKFKAARTRMEVAKTDLERRLAFQDFEKEQRKVSPTLDPTLLKLHSEVEGLKQQFQSELIRDMLRKRTPFEKFQDAAVKWSRVVKLSSVNVFPKLIQAGLIRQIAEPISRIVGQPLRFISPQTFAKARAETGITVRSQAANLAGVLTSPKKLWQKLTTQKTDLDILSGKRARDVEMLNFVGNAHGVIKEPVRQGAFRETVQLETEKAIKEGLDVREPVVQAAILSRGVEQADRRIFMQDNPFSRYLVRNVVGGLRNAGKTQVGLRTLANTLDFLMPIVRVSSNIAVHTARLQAGLPEAFIRLAVAAKRGQLGRGGALPESEALTIARAYKTGSMGLLLGAYAWNNPQYFGGAFGESTHPTKGDLKPGDIKTPWFTIPHQINHYPEAAFLNTVASARRVYDRYMTKNPDKKLDAQLEAAAFATMTPVKNFPMVDVWLRTFAAHNSGAEVLAAMARDATIPTAIPSTMTLIEQHQGIERKAKGPIEQIEMSIPGLRQKVSEKGTTGAVPDAQ